MPALPLADVYAPDDFAPLPDDDAERRHRYLNRCRTVRVGPVVTVVFENQETLWFRVQELARVAKATGNGSVQKELDWYAGLLPHGNALVAAVWVSEPGRRPSKELDRVRLAIAAGTVGFRADDGREVRGTFRTDRVADKLVGLALWVEFRFTYEDRAAFSDRTIQWVPFVEADGYSHAGESLSSAVRASLVTDLTSRR